MWRNIEAYQYDSVFRLEVVYHKVKICQAVGVDFRGFNGFCPTTGNSQPLRKRDGVWGGESIE